ncbi:MAG: hypothetical protein H6558_00635 [Lewinellaceae bacterium]|nr:hypothetical protein [Lewinellaceae bacterium]
MTSTTLSLPLRQRIGGFWMTTTESGTAVVGQVQDGSAARLIGIVINGYILPGSVQSSRRVVSWVQRT